MNTKTRLAAREFSKNRNISISKRVAFPGSTPHGHDFYELDIIVSGTVNAVTNGKGHVMKSQDIAFMTPADFHEYKYDEPFDLYNVQFTSDAVSEVISTEIFKMQGRIFSLSKGDSQKILTLLELMREFDSENEKNADILSRMLECILLVLTRNPKKADGCKRNQSQGILRALSYVNSHFKENPSLGEIAALAMLNERYFCSRFKEYTGKSYKEYLKELKLSYARRLLLATELSVIEISEQSGYSTQSHFNREFKDFYGTSPLKMRKNGTIG